MDKRKYYVSVQSKTIMEHQGDAPYEFEIEATPADLEELKELFDNLESFDEKSYFRMMTPVPYHYDSPNDGHDYYLREIYRKIQSLGTEETRSHIASWDMQQRHLEEEDV